MEAPKNQETPETELSREAKEALDAPYKAERQEGYNRAQTMIENIEGYEQMDYREKFGALHDLLEKATDRFEEDYIAAHMYEIEQLEEKDKIDEDLARMRHHYKQAA